MSADDPGVAGPSSVGDAAVVRETGLAVVHEGERIIAAAGASAIIDGGTGGGGVTVNYYFPIEIIVAGSLPEAEREAIEARVWEGLSDAIQRFA